MASSSDFRTSAHPDKVDLRQYLWPVENMGSVIATAAASAAIALELHVSARMGEKPTNLSTLFIHYNARRLSGDQDKNVGTTMAAVMEAIRTYGACTEATWPFDPAKLTISPPPEAYEEAKKFAGQQTLYPLDVVDALALTYALPFLTRIPVRCLEEAGRTQVMPALTEEERQKIKEHPGQALVVVGYDQTDKTFLVRHFVGDQWGDRGHCRIPFDVFWSLVPKEAGTTWIIEKPKVEKTESAVLAVAPAAAAADRHDIVEGVATLRTPRDVHAAALPDKVDLREYLWPVEDVGEIPAAAAAAASVALEYHCNRIGERPTNLSTLFIHYNARRLSGEQSRNTGTTMDAVMQAIATFGSCPEAAWPLDAAQVTAAPPADAYQQAKTFAVVRAGHPVDIFEALSLEYPVPFTARIPKRCLTEAGRTKTIPPLNAEERREPNDHPAHAMVLVGYDKADKTFLARNCWGDQWGDRGYCRIPFDVFNAWVPRGSTQAWYIAPTDVAKVAEAPPPVAVAAVTPQPAPRPAAAPQAAAASQPAAAASVTAAAASAPPESLAEMAARMRSEIRESVTRDIADATRQIRERMTPPPGRPGGTRLCTVCNGSGKCQKCGGNGCGSCNRTGRCGSCS